MMISSKTLILLVVCYSGFLDARYEKIPGAKKAPVIATLFEWNFKDIADECETFLAPFGYSAVQVSPVFEHAVIEHPFWDKRVSRPWYERYQPVSFKIASRSGDKHDFKKMVKRCNAVGVGVIVDVEINHMTSNINGRGTAGSPYKGQKFYYPEAGFGPDAFHGRNSCPTKSLAIEDQSNLIELKNCEVFNRHDLAHENPMVLKTIVKHLQKLLDLGVAGFHIDSARYIWPGHLHDIFQNLDLGPNFSRDETPFITNDVEPCYCIHEEVVDPEQYKALGTSREYLFATILGDMFTSRSPDKLSEIRNILTREKLIDSNAALVFTDNRQLQRLAPKALNFRQAKQLKMANAFMLAWPYGIPNIMSSYDWPLAMQNGWDVNSWMAPPLDRDGISPKVTRNRDLSCQSPWRCEHRWRQIYNMVKFRTIVENAPIQNWWDDGDNAIAFGRGTLGFIAINAGNKVVRAKLKTGMIQGLYCDVISGNLVDNECTGKMIKVGEDGDAEIELDPSSEDPMIAFHMGSKIESKEAENSDDSDLDYEEIQPKVTEPEENLGVPEQESNSQAPEGLEEPSSMESSVTSESNEQSSDSSSTVRDESLTGEVEEEVEKTEAELIDHLMESSKPVASSSQCSSEKLVDHCSICMQSLMKHQPRDEL